MQVYCALQKFIVCISLKFKVVLDVSCIIHEAMASHNTVPTEKEFLIIYTFLITNHFMYTVTVTILL
jgi:hypothetical protein